MLRKTILAAVGALLLVAAPVTAQEAGTVEAPEIEAALDAHHADADADRDAVRRVLDTPQLQEVADEMGVDVEQLQSAAEMLEGERLETAADHARDIEVQLAGGQNISISATTLIVVLLLVILIVVVAD